YNYLRSERRVFTSSRAPKQFSQASTAKNYVRYCETCSTTPSNTPCRIASPLFSRSPNSRTVWSFGYRMTAKAFLTGRGPVFSNPSFESIRHDRRKPGATVWVSACASALWKRTEGPYTSRATQGEVYLLS